MFMLGGGGSLVLEDPLCTFKGNEGLQGAVLFPWGYILCQCMQCASDEGKCAL